ncbi:MAG: DUF4215 domain-containing protein [Polyangiaceae bacterium]
MIALTAAGCSLAACSPPDSESDRAAGDEHVGEAASALGQPLLPETEPNGVSLQANPIGTDVVVRGNVNPNSDVDLFAFQAPANSRVYAAIMSGFAAGSTDADLDIIGTDGTTVLETDDSNGVLSSLAPAIAGTQLAAAGTYYLKARNFGTSQTRPYDLHFKLQTGAPVPETEPNDMTPQALPAGGWVSGTLSAATDIDVFTIQLNAGDTVYATLDLDPTRDGTDTAGALSFGPFLGSAIQANDGGTTGPDAEALFSTVIAAGTYGIGVSGTAVGDYHLSVSVHPAAPSVSCTTFTSSDVPKVIPAAGGAVTSTITVPGSARIGDVNVTMQFNHAAPADVDAQLTAPAGNTIGLFTDVGGAPFTTIDTILDDEAARPISSTTGFLISNGEMLEPELDYRLSWFDGENAGGQWTLSLTDDTNNANGGNLTGWGLTICDAPIPAVQCAGGAASVTAFTTDFEAGDAGFTHSGTADTWARGTPSAAPFTTCNSGTSCWKTNLTGTYSTSSINNLVSPPINLTPKAAPLQLRWAMKYQIENASFDHAYVEIHEVGGANPKRLWEWQDGTMTTTIGAATLQESAGWATFYADVSAYAGKQVELLFHVDSDTSINLGGLAIDDVSLTGCNAQVCGNGVKEGSEICDDGNQVNGDGCDTNCTASACGNGVKAPNEACDDGNLTDGDGCDSNCTATACGNGVKTMGEACDDGNLTDGDGCDSNCTATACGNGVKTMGEACDDGNLTDGDGCDSNCTATACGNNVVTMGEVCDDGNLTDGDGCDSNCTVTACGNNIVTAGEVCDDGNKTDGDGCDTNCTITACGNGIVTLGEMCDDGNGMLGDGCDDGVMGNCTPSACGNGVLAGGEGCDDGNLVDGDGCDANCTMTGCGNGVTTMGEDCDDGNATSGDGCDNNCTKTACGNGVQTDGEACDDGNLVDGDGCDTNCTMSACGNGVQAPDEMCDDGNVVDGDGCDSNCTPTACNNGVKTDGEACDDGNKTDGDGCDSNCTASACGNGVQAPDETCDDGNVVDGDGCDSNCTPTACGNGIKTDPEECDDGNTNDGDGCDSSCVIESATGGAGGGGGTTGGSGGTTTTGGSGGTTSSGGATSSGGSDGGKNTTDGGCGCAVPGQSDSRSPITAILVLAGLAVTRLRRRTSRRNAA